MKQPVYILAIIASPFGFAGLARQPLSAAQLRPVITIDFPDPFIMQHDGGFLAFGTNATELRTVQP